MAKNFKETARAADAREAGRRAAREAAKNFDPQGMSPADAGGILFDDAQRRHRAIHTPVWLTLILVMLMAIGGTLWVFSGGSYGVGGSTAEITALNSGLNSGFASAQADREANQDELLERLEDIEGALGECTSMCDLPPQPSAEPVQGVCWANERARGVTRELVPLGEAIYDGRVRAASADIRTQVLISGGLPVRAPVCDYVGGVTHSAPTPVQHAPIARPCPAGTADTGRRTESGARICTSATSVEEPNTQVQCRSPLVPQWRGGGIVCLHPGGGGNGGGGFTPTNPGERPQGHGGTSDTPDEEEGGDRDEDHGGTHANPAAVPEGTAEEEGGDRSEGGHGGTSA